MTLTPATCLARDEAEGRVTARAAAERRAAGHADVVLISADCTAPARARGRAMRAAGGGGPRSTSGSDLTGAGP